MIIQHSWTSRPACASSPDLDDPYIPKSWSDRGGRTRIHRQQLQLQQSGTRLQSRAKARQGRAAGAASQDPSETRTSPYTPWSTRRRCGAVHLLCRRIDASVRFLQALKRNPTNRVCDTLGRVTRVLSGVKAVVVMTMVGMCHLNGGCPS